MREIVTVQVGQCGNKVGEKVSERKIEKFSTFNQFFRLKSSGKSFLMNTTSTAAVISMATVFFLINVLAFSTKLVRKKFSFHALCCVTSKQAP